MAYLQGPNTTFTSRHGPIRTASALTVSCSHQPAFMRFSWLLKPVGLVHAVSLASPVFHDLNDRQQEVLSRKNGASRKHHKIKPLQQMIAAVRHRGKPKP
jgi:hypothetical protein